MIATRSRWFLVGFLVMPLISVSVELSAKPPRHELPVGHKEWSKTRQFPSEYDIWFGDRPNTGRAFMIDAWNDNQAWFRVDIDETNKKQVLEITLNAKNQLPMATSLYSGDFLKWRLVQGDVFPIFRELYSVTTVRSNLVVLTRVTDKFPEEIRPAKRSRTIATNAVTPYMFWEQDPMRRDKRDLDEVRISKIDGESRRAAIELIPGILSTRNYGPSERMRQSLEVGKGELLTARGRSYRVLNVVPPQDFRGGKLVGWIELAPDPVMPEADE